MALNDDVGSSLDLLEEDLGRNAQMTSEFEKELGRLRQSMLFTSREVTTLSSGLERGLGRAIDGLVLDGGKLSDALKTVGQSLADTVYSIAMKPVETALAGSLAGGVASIMGNGSFGQAITPFAKGGGLFPRSNHGGQWNSQCAHRVSHAGRDRPDG